MSERINTPPQCLDTAEMCQGCESGCSFLEKGNEIKALQRQLGQKTLEVEGLRRTKNLLTYDSIMKGVYSKKGFLVELTEDQELQEELKSGDFGVIFLDLRGLKAVNDTISEHAGDELLVAFADMIVQKASENVRSEEPEFNEKSRWGTAKKVFFAMKRALNKRKNPEIKDKVIRWGGDEAAVLVRYITPDELQKVEERFIEVFSPNSAMSNDRRKKVPVMASLSTMHARNLEEEVDDLEVEEFFLKVVDGAQKKHHQGAKKAQYAKIKNLVGVFFDKASPRVKEEMRPLLENSDDRMVALAFFKYLCPNFYARELNNSRSTDA